MTDSVSTDLGTRLQTIWDALLALVGAVAGLGFDLLKSWPLLILWVVVCLWAINWKKAWPVLAQGGWMPLCLSMVLVALIWSQLKPSRCDCLGFVSVGNFWWQLGEVGLIVAVGMMCGWVQGLMNWAPADVEINPSSGHHDSHDHGHAHAHDEHAPAPIVAEAAHAHH